MSTCSKNASLIDIRGNAFSKYLVSENSYFYVEASSIFIFKGASQKCQLLKIWQRNDEIFINLCLSIPCPCRLGWCTTPTMFNKISALNENKNISIIFCRIVCRMACWKNSRDRVERMAMEEENRPSICSFFFQKLFKSSRFRDVLQLSFVDKRTNFGFSPTRGRMPTRETDGRFIFRNCRWDLNIFMSQADCWLGHVWTYCCYTWRHGGAAGKMGEMKKQLIS